jgi:hypothetical protein
MPLRQYLYCVGGVLLAILFILDAYFPKPPVVEKAQANLPVIRIHSDRKWPERVVYDTSLPTIVPAPIVGAEVQTPEAIGGAPPSTRAGEAFAMLKMPAGQVPRSNAKMREPKPRHQTKIARRRESVPRFAMAHQMQFGWFGGNFW